ncbi:phage N-6-adenine-methyltransferase [Serratia rhizosphaerae]|uniref:Phage N-6-adenine-methyltransferase n=1 Tax=Serratia rhizosphaerae TaxID=2597702 RepID=A0ABX6GH11_9GAMM|nr:phage N-6-adenine-methyltransferase [Serratia rhizosphaerae]QHA85564.1 phage N-6-adenine-methyltransferase [Serratia rhizosphaerae]
MKSDYLGGSQTPPEHKDRWQTPIEVFGALDVEFGFYLDAAAEHSNALCSRYLTERENALAVDWESYGAIWCNPPYSSPAPWVEKAAEQCRVQNQPIVMLLPADTSVGWFSLALQSVDEVRFITEGRISFINAGTGKPVNGNNKGSMFLIWRPFIKPRCQFTTVSRADLLGIGAATLREVAA